MRCPYCNDSNFLILSDSGYMSDEHGANWKWLVDADQDEINTVINSRNYGFKCSSCGSYLQHSYIKNCQSS